MQMTRETLLIIRRRTHALVLAVLITSLVAACDSRSPVSSSATGATPTLSPPPSSSSTRYLLSGRVLTDAGVPIADAVVEVNHGRASASASTSTCPSIAVFCWVATRTNSNGEYTLEFEAADEARPGVLPSLSAGFVYSFADGYETNIQWVPRGSSTPVQDLRLRRIGPIRPGEPTSVSVEPTSSLCSDLEDTFQLDYRCEVVHIDASREVTVVVEARDAQGGGATPEALFFATSGNYIGPWVRTGPSTLAATLTPGVSRIFVGIRDGATRRFDIVTSVR
jgi:hypothetical protein